MQPNFQHKIYVLNLYYKTEQPTRNQNKENLIAIKKKRRRQKKLVKKN